MDWTCFTRGKDLYTGVTILNSMHELTRGKLSEVWIVERVFREKPTRKMGGGFKDMPRCERCGRPVKISSTDYSRDEILCAHCAADARASDLVEYEFSRR